MRKVALAAVSELIAVTPANATTTATGDTSATHEREDRDFPWGLLGLLGLAGLLGRKRDDRRDTYRDTTAGTGTR